MFFFFFFFFSPSWLFICFPLFFFIVAKKIEKSDVHCNCCRIAKFFKFFLFCFFFFSLFFSCWCKEYLRSKNVFLLLPVSLSLFPSFVLLRSESVMINDHYNYGIKPKEESLLFLFFHPSFSLQEVKKKKNY